MPERSRRPPTALPQVSAPRMRSGMQGSASARSSEARAFYDDAWAKQRPVSQPVLRAQPTAETADALRSLLDQHLSTVVAETQAEQALQEELQEAAAEESEESDELDPQLQELLEQLQAAEERAAYAEQQAMYAGQQAAQAAQQLALQSGNALPQHATAHDESEAPARGSAFAAWGGWCVAVLAVCLAAGAYVTSYRPLREQLVAQTKLTELQATGRAETEAALRSAFDREREALNERLNTAQAAAAAATASASAQTADASAVHEAAADGGDHASTSKAAKSEARAAKREAWLAKKAERSAKHEERAAKHKAHTTASRAADGGDSDKAHVAEPKHKAKPATDDTGDESGSNDPLEGL